MGPIELERAAGMMLALTSFLPPIISSRPVGLETDQGPPLLLPSRSITCRCNHFAGTHWAPKVVPFLAVDDTLTMSQ
jgi:hypothetical protein